MWQPIDTYSDGPVLAYFPNAMEVSRVMKVERLTFDDDPDGPQWWLVDVDGGSPLDVEPTHWMPLPEYPA